MVLFGTRDRKGFERSDACRLIRTGKREAGKRDLKAGLAFNHVCGSGEVHFRIHGFVSAGIKVQNK